MIIIDSHSHLNFSAFDKDRKKVIEKCLNNKIWMINIGTKYETSEKAVEIAEKYKKGVYAAIGLHPLHLKTGVLDIKTDSEEGNFKIGGEEFDYQKYKQLAQKSKKIVAIGEVGLDYYYLPEKDKEKELLKEKQKDVLLTQIKLAKEFNLPLIFHCRKGHSDFISILEKESNKSEIKGTIHCFTGKWREAKKYLEMGFYLGFNGIIFKMNLKEIIKKMPLDRILVETDCPYLTPSDFPEKRNNPLAVKLIVEKIAGIKKEKIERIAEITTQNTQRLFRI